MAWGRRRSGEGRDFLSRAAQLPAVPEGPLLRVIQRFPAAGSGRGRRVVRDSPGDSRASCPLPVLGAMVSPVRAGITTVGRKGPGGQSCDRNRSGAQLRMEQAGAMG